MGSVTRIQTKTDTRATQTPRETPRPGNLPRTMGTPFIAPLVVFTAATFTMGFVAGAVCMAWFRS